MCVSLITVKNRRVLASSANRLESLRESSTSMEEAEGMLDKPEIALLNIPYF